MTLFDISPILHAGIAVWPEDVGFSRQVHLAISGGSNIDLSSMTTTMHVGAHADAPSHYHRDGQAIDAIELTPYWGPCRVIQVLIAPGGLILPKHLLGHDTALPQRVLFATGSFPNPDVFNEDFVAFAAETIDALAKLGVQLVGIDTPSVDPFSSKDLPAHQALMRHGMRNLEGLVLTGVPAGDYELSALPLKIRGADASPVRAVLRVSGLP